MKKILQQNFPFLFPYLVFLLAIGFLLALYPKGDIHLAINQYRYTFCDYFFFCATYIGDGIAVISLIFFLCLFKYRFAILTGAANLISFGITQTLKHTLYADVVRPKKYFEGVAELNFVPWVENWLYNSFPSGHTTAAFTTFFCLSLILKNKALKFIMFIIALTIGFSRIYLSQHFLNDVYAGSLIGVVTSLAVYYFIFISEKSKNAAWMERSLLSKKQ